MLQAFFQTLVVIVWWSILIDNLRQWAKEINFKWSHVTQGSGAMHFVGSNSVEYCDILSGHLRQLYVTTPSWWNEYNSYRLTYQLALPVSAYYSRFTLRASCHDPLFRIAVAEMFVLTMTSFILTEILGAPPLKLQVFTETAIFILQGVQLHILSGLP